MWLCNSINKIILIIPHGGGKEKSPNHINCQLFFSPLIGGNSHQIPNLFQDV